MAFVFLRERRLIVTIILSHNRFRTRCFFQYLSTSKTGFNNLTMSAFSKTLYLDHPHKIEISSKTFRKKKIPKLNVLEPIQIVLKSLTRIGFLE